MTAVAGEAATFGWYVYGVVPAAEAQSVSQRVAAVRAIDADRRVRIVSHDAVAAIVSEVTLGEFGEAVLPERLADRAWLEDKVRAHDTVLAAALGGTAIVPLRFGTICRDVGDVHELLAARSSEFERALERVRGRVELGVKAFLDRDRVADALREQAPSEDAAESGGRAYLLRRQRDRRVADDVVAFCSDCGASAHERLCGHAVDARLNRPQSRELTGRTDEMFMNGAYLVAHGADGLAAEVTALGRDYERFGISFELTGPWPPYNFVAVEEEHE
jgi:hypothetical protein